MSEDEPNLHACMQKLKIMPRPRLVKIYRDEELPLKLNPFARRNRVVKSHHKTQPQQQTSLFGPGCPCRRRRTQKNSKFKRPTNVTYRNKVLREPVIVLFDKCSHIPSKNLPGPSGVKSRLFGENNLSQQDFKSIIAGCQQLSIASTSRTDFSTQNFRETRNNNSATATTQQRVDKMTATSATSVSSNASCSQQAMARICLNPPCDVTIDELASYFETFVHIPKKMSSMAEMMYI